MPAPANSNLEDVLSGWASASETSRLASFRSLGRGHREELFLQLYAADQAALIVALPEHEGRSYLRFLAPDDAADVIQEADIDRRDSLLAMLDDSTRDEVVALLAYAEDEAGGLMNPRFARLRPEMTVNEAITYLRLQG